MMLWCYLLSYDPTETLPQTLVRELDALHDGVVNWVAPFAGAIAVVSPLEGNELAQLLRQETSLRRKRFVVLDTKTDRGGWLPKSLWALIHNPQPVGYEDDDDET